MVGPVWIEKSCKIWGLQEVLIHHSALFISRSAWFIFAFLGSPHSTTHEFATWVKAGTTIIHTGQAFIASLKGTICTIEGKLWTLDRNLFNMNGFRLIEPTTMFPKRIIWHIIYMCNLIHSRQLLRTHPKSKPQRHMGEPGEVWVTAFSGRTAHRMRAPRQF